MKENKADRKEMGEAWERMEKAVNRATELYLEEFETYLGWVGNVQREMLEQALATSKQLSEIGGAQFAFLTRMRKELPAFGAIPAWTEVFRAATGTAEAPTGRPT
jgi:hypothetical protein